MTNPDYQVIFHCYVRTLPLYPTMTQCTVDLAAFWYESVKLPIIVRTVMVME